MPKAAKKGTQCSKSGRKLAQCRWGVKAKPKGKPKPKARKPKLPTRASRRLAGKEPVRHPEPPKKPRKKAAKSRAPVKSNYKAERAILGDPMYGMPLYGKGVSVLDGARKQFRQAGYDRDV